MAVTSAQVSVAATAVALTPVETGSTPGPTMVTVKNTGSTDIQLGGSGVTPSTGFTLIAGGSLTVELTTGEQLFAIGVAVAVTVHVLRTGV